MRFVLVILFAVSYLGSFAQSENSSNWFTDLSAAEAYAVEHNVNILMVFAGSDWCRPCKKLKKDVLEADAFKDHASKELAILYLDFPSRKKNRLSKEATLHNEKLAEQYNTSGAFPKMILFDKKLQKLKELGYKGQTANEFVSMLNRASE